jgi:hypothetical protein
VISMLFNLTLLPLEEIKPWAAPATCEYQVARLYEDVIEVAAHALEPIPADLIPHIAGAGRRRTLRTVDLARQARRTRR